MTILVVLAGLLVVSASTATAASAPIGATTRVSVATGGIQANGFSGRQAIGADGRYVAFGSWATNLVSGDANGKVDVFVRDRVAGTTLHAASGSEPAGTP